MFGEELVILALQAVVEFLFHLVVWFPWDILLFWRERTAPADRRSADAWLVPLGGILFGALFGGLSLLLLPTALLRNAEARVLNLILGPLLCAALSSLLARRRNRQGAESDVKLHFSFALSFSAALLLIRFIWANRPA